MFKLVITAAALATTVVASPTNIARQSPGPSCDGLGSGAFDTASHFSITALNTTLPNANLTGVPIVYGTADEEPVGVEFKLLSTWFSTGSNDFHTSSLISGALLPDNAGPAGDVTDSVVGPDTIPLWFISSLGVGEPNDVYCAVPNPATGFPKLAVNGDTESFFLCSQGDFPSAQNVISWKPTNVTGSGIDFTTCYNVHLQLVGLD